MSTGELVFWWTAAIIGYLIVGGIVFGIADRIGPTFTKRIDANPYYFTFVWVWLLWPLVVVRGALWFAWGATIGLREFVKVLVTP